MATIQRPGLDCSSSGGGLTLILRGCTSAMMGSTLDPGGWTATSVRVTLTGMPIRGDDVRVRNRHCLPMPKRPRN